MDHGETRQMVQGILDPYLKTINETPALLNLLYEANLLPEQCTTVNAALAIAVACEAYQLGKEAR